MSNGLPPFRCLMFGAIGLMTAVSGASSAYGCERYAAPFFRGSGGFVVQPSDGRSAGVTVQARGETDARTVFARRDGLVVQLLSSPLCSASAGGLPSECQVTFTGIRGGGWYWVNGERNAAVAPLMCEADLGGAAPLDPGGVETIRGGSGKGTLFVHDTQGLMGIVPHLSSAGGASCERWVAPYFRGAGGFVARPREGPLELTIGRDGSTARETFVPRGDGLVVRLLSDSRCTDANGEAVECQVSFTGIEDGGWYWVNGDRNAAVAPLVCEGRAAGVPALDPGGVETGRGAFGIGSLFLHDRQRLMGLVPHLSGASDDDRRVEVRVSVFGGGAVEVVGDGNLTCPVAKSCTGFFPAAGALTLRAAGSFGYAFDRWKGCDSVSGADCVVALHADRQVSVDFLSTQPLAFRDNVVSFDSARLADVQQYDPVSGLMVLAADARLDDVGVGSILVSSVVDLDRAFESWFLRRVTDMWRLTGSPAYLTTTHATLEDLIAEGSLAVRAALGAEAVSSYVLPPGLVPVSHPASELTVRELPDGRRSWEVSRSVERLDAAVSPPGSVPEENRLPAASGPGPIEFSLDREIAPGITVSGMIGLTVEPSFFVEPPREFKGQATISARFDLKVEAAGVEVDRDWRVPLDQLQLTFNAVRYGNFPFSLVVTPSLTGDLYLKVSSSAGFEPSVTLEAEATAGAHWLRGEGWSGIWKFDRRTGVNVPGFEARAAVEAGVLLESKLKVFSVAGPVVGVGPHVGVSAFTLNPPRGSCRWDYEAYLGGSAEYGGEFKVFGWGLEYQKTLWDGRFTLPWGRSCPEDVPVEPPSPLNVRFPSAAADSIAVEWDAPRQTGEDYPIGYELVRRHDPGLGPDRIERKEFAVAGTRFEDAGLFPNTEYCYTVRTVVAGVSRSAPSRSSCERTRTPDAMPPEAPSGISAAAGSSGTISLRWNASISDDVSHYVVLQVPEGGGLDDGVGIGSTERLRHDVTDLFPGAEYCFGVSAVDGEGNASDVVESACAVAGEAASAGVTRYEWDDGEFEGGFIKTSDGDPVHEQAYAQAFLLRRAGQLRWLEACFQPWGSDVAVEHDFTFALSYGSEPGDESREWPVSARLTSTGELCWREEMALDLAAGEVWVAVRWENDEDNLVGLLVDRFGPARTGIRGRSRRYSSSNWSGWRDPNGRDSNGEDRHCIVDGEREHCEWKALGLRMGVEHASPTFVNRSSGSLGGRPLRQSGESPDRPGPGAVAESGDELSAGAR